MGKRYSKWVSISKIFGEDIHYAAFLLTPTTINKVKEAAHKYSTTESFIVECLIRVGLNVAKDYYINNNFSPGENKRSPDLRHGEAKQTPQKQWSITISSSKLLSEIAQSLGESRSEVLEFAIRGGGLDKAQELIEHLLASE